MSNCKICGKDSTLICLCGFCDDCIEEFGHDTCEEIAKKKEEKKNAN